MNHRHLLPFALLSAPLLSGCVRTVASVVTAPVRVAGKAVDWTTTSQSESDEKRGRALRKREAEMGRIDRQYEKNRRACQNGDQAACDRARNDYATIQDLRDRPI